MQHSRIPRIPREESLRIPGIPVDTRDPNLGIRDPNLGIPPGSLRCSWSRIPGYKQNLQPRRKQVYLSKNVTSRVTLIRAGEGGKVIEGEAKED